MHTARFMQKGAKILEFELREPKKCVSKYYGGDEDIVMSVFENPDGSHVYVFVNGGTEKKQVQIEERGQLYYLLLLPGSASTVVFDFN